MKKKKTHRLDPVIEIAENRQQEAARQLAGLMQHQDVLSKQTLQLINYRDDYKKNWFESKKLSSSNLVDHQLFLSRLNTNIEIAATQLQTIKKSLKVKMDYWQQTRTMSRALEKLVERYQAKERVNHYRQLQKEQDEQASLFRKNSRPN